MWIFAALAGVPGLVGERAVGGAVGRGARLLAPALGDRSRVDGVVADRVEESGHRRLGLRVVARDGQGGAVGGAVRAGQRAQVLEEDVVEHLHHVGVRQVALQQPAAGDRADLQLFDVPVALGIVVAGVEDGLAGQRLDRNLGKGLHRDADHHEVARLGGLLGGAGGCERAEFGGEFGQCLRAAGVAHHDVVPGRHAQPGHRAADHPAANDAYGCHDRANPGNRLIIPKMPNGPGRELSARPVAVLLSAPPRPRPSARPPVRRRC